MDTPRTVCMLGIKFGAVILDNPISLSTNFWVCSVNSVILANLTHFLVFQICTPDLVVFLACSNQRLKERLEKRAEQQGRPDDNPKATERRLANFKQNAVPLVKYFQEKGLIVTVRKFGFLKRSRHFEFFLVLIFKK